MATTLELSVRIRALEEAVSKLQSMRVDHKKPEEGRKLCPHCGEKPAHFFHVKNCPKNKNKNDDRSGNPGGS